MKSEQNLLNNQSNIQKLFFRQTDGTLLQTQFNPNQQIKQTLNKLYHQQNTQINVIYKGKLLQLNTTFNDNKIKPGSIIHILKGTTQDQQSSNNYVYIRFKNILYKIELKPNDTVINFQQKVQNQTSLPYHLQKIQHKGKYLETHQQISNYHIEKQDILNLQELQPSNYEESLELIEEDIIFPININTRSRRGSTGQKNDFDQSNQTDKSTNHQPLYKSDFNLQEKVKNNIQSNQQVNVLATSSQFGSHLLQQNHNGVSIKLGNSVNSQQGDSPLLRPNKNLSKSGKGIFNGDEIKNSFTQQNALNFRFEDDQQQFNFETKTNQILNLQDAFDNLMNHGNQLVLCQSYYDYEDKKINAHGSSTEITKSGGQVNDIKESSRIKKQFQSQQICSENKIENIKRCQQSEEL